MTREYTVGCLFAGMGGFALAFKRAGFKVLWANDKDRYASMTFQHNFPDTKFYAKPIEELSVTADSLEPVDVLTAGFPCQSFSVAGNKMGFNDSRGQAFFEVVRILREFGRDRPKIVLLENVKNLLYHDNGRTFERIVREIQATGYWFKKDNARVLNTKDITGIPQNRERLFMAAMSWDAFKRNSFEFPKDPAPLRNLSDFLDLDKKADPEFYFDEESKYGKMFADAMARGNQNSVYLLRKTYVRENKSNTVFTLTANMGEGGHNVPVIKDNWGIRKLTPRECLRLQGYRDGEFSFPPGLSKTQQYKQIGNTVTVSLVEQLAAECLSKLKKLEGGQTNSGDRVGVSAEQLRPGTRVQ